MVPSFAYRISLFLTKIFYQKKISKFHSTSVSRYDINRIPFKVAWAQVKIS